jgi:cellobiose epimerase
MITRREFTRKAAATSITLSSSAGLLDALGQNRQDRSGKPEGQKATLPEWSNHIDPTWVRETLIGGLLDHWLRASVMPNGFIQENLDRDWTPWGTQREASLNGQGRQLYCMARGYEMTRRQDYLDAVHKCADFLLKMRDPEYGGFFNRTSPDLKVIDDKKTDFTSFAIFPLAHIARITGEEIYAQEAMKAWREVSSKMRAGDFFNGSMKRDFSGTAPSPYGGAARSGNNAPGAAVSNNHRLSEHMFEALLALYQTTKDRSVWQEIERQVALMIRLFNREDGFLPETYTQDGKAIPTTNFNVGHLFEWAALFSQAVELGADPKLIELGSRNIDMGIKIGVDQGTGGTWTSATAQGGTPPRKNMLWWPECETIKATARYAIRHGRSDLWPTFDRCLEFVRTNFFDRTKGGWFETVVPGEPRENLGARAYIKGAVDGPEWGSYHQTAAFTDLLHVTGTL